MSMDDLAGRKALLKASRLQSGRILDVGMGGCGCMSFFLAKRGFHVVGIDDSMSAVHTAEKDAKKENFTGSFIAQMTNAETLSFSDGEFDAVFAYHSMHHIDHLEEVINEMFRVCKSGGIVAVADLNEKGRKAYDHKLDGGEFLKKIQGLLGERAKSMRKKEYGYNMMFICKKA